jgi:hypothetical protein
MSEEDNIIDPHRNTRQIGLHGHKFDSFFSRRQVTRVIYDLHILSTYNKVQLHHPKQQPFHVLTERIQRCALSFHLAVAVQTCMQLCKFREYVSTCMLKQFLATCEFQERPRSLKER